MSYKGLYLACIAILAQALYPQEPVKCTPTNTTIGFDIDDVLLQRSEPLKTTLWNYRWDIAKNSINPYLWYNVMYLLYHRSTGKAYLDLFKSYAPRLAEMVERMTMEKKPVEGMEPLVEQLHQRAYTLVIASNMSSYDFNYYKTKFPTLFSHFTYAKTVPYSEDGKPLACKKPSLTYFKELKQELVQQGLAKQQTLFIDDKKKNVEASQQEGFIGKVFTTAADLSHYLQRIGIL